MKKKREVKQRGARRTRAKDLPRSAPITIVLADDHHVVRQGMAAIIATAPDLKVIGEACDGEEALAFYSKLKPDVLVLDLRMPVLDGFEVVKRVIAVDPQARILVMTTYDSDEDIWRCLRAGAKGYLLKDATQPEIVSGIRAVARGESFTSPLLAAKLAHRAASPELTAREAEVLQLVDQGMTNKEIAVSLQIGAGTVKTHLKSLFAKIGATTRTAATKLARDRGLIH